MDDLSQDVASFINVEARSEVRGLGLRHRQAAQACVGGAEKQDLWTEGLTLPDGFELGAWQSTEFDWARLRPAVAASSEPVLPKEELLDSGTRYELREVHIDSV